jgi:hypothetical protein
MSFDRAIEFIIKHETVYKRGHYGDFKYAVSQNVPGDDGGLTKFGVDQRSHPKEDIENLTYERAVEIYKQEYWDKCGAEKLPWPLDLVQVDGAVNTGIGQQNKFLQRAVGAKDDGKFGPQTLGKTMETVSNVGVVNVCKSVIYIREQFYKDLASRRPDKHKFLKGWLNRLSNLREVVTAI